MRSCVMSNRLIKMFKQFEESSTNSEWLLVVQALRDSLPGGRVIKGGGGLIRSKNSLILVEVAYERSVGAMFLERMM